MDRLTQYVKCILINYILKHRIKNQNFNLAIIVQAKLCALWYYMMYMIITVTTCNLQVFIKILIWSHQFILPLTHKITHQLFWFSYYDKAFMSNLPAASFPNGFSAILRNQKHLWKLDKLFKFCFEPFVACENAWNNCGRTASYNDPNKVLLWKSYYLLSQLKFTFP